MQTGNCADYSFFPNSSYCLERKGYDYDFEIDPEPEHTSEILMFGQ